MNMPGASQRTLLLLTLGVLLAHLAALRHAALPVTAGDVVLRALVTRSVPASAEVVKRAESAAAPNPEIAVVHRPSPPAAAAAAISEEKTAVQRSAPQSDASVSVATSTPTSPAHPVEAAAVTEPAPAPPLRERVRATALRVPGSAILNYNVIGTSKGRQYDARGSLSWRHDGERYEARFEAGAFLLGSRSQTSAGRITGDGLEPVRFSDKARSEQAAHFERDKGRISFSGNTAESPLLAGAQDRLSVVMQIGAMLAGEPDKYPQATTITVQTAGTREADTWLFTVEGNETLALAGREIATVKVTRNPRKEFDQKVEIWFAPALDYLPARLRLTQANGDWLDQQWRSTDRP